MTRRATAVPRLILVDGFAGSGKSTTAQRLCLQLRRAGQPAAWFHEHQAAHPIFCYDEVEELLELTPDAFEDQILANWTAFALDEDPAAVRILEGSFFQLTVGVMLSMNMPALRIARALVAIDRIIEPLDPALIHLFHRHTRDGLLKIRDHRGAYWLDGMTTIVGRSPYGKRHRVRDVEGLVAFYRTQQNIIDAVLPRLRVRRLGIEIGHGAWSAYARKMSAFLSLGRPNASTPSWRELRRCIGRYRTGAGRECTVATDGASLYLQEALAPAQRLLPAGAGCFCVESLPIDVQFRPDGRGASRRLVIRNHLVNAPAETASFARAGERASSR